jgi:FlaA1/EpsC-like NDP-sugar epimerase
MPVSIEHLLCLKGKARLFAVVAVHLCLFAASGYCAFLLRFEFNLPPSQLAHLFYALAIWLTVKSLVFQLLTVNRGTWRFVSLPDALTLLFANVIGSLVSAIVIDVVAPAGFPRSIYLSDLALCLLLTTGIRVLVRMLAETPGTNVRSENYQALIYGAGAAGVMLLRETRSNPTLGYQVCGFIDDDPSKTGLSIHGVRVLGAGEALNRVAEKHGIQHILIAIPSATGTQMIKILSYCASAKLSFRTVPALSEVMRNNGASTPIREVAVEDLLGRTQVLLEDANVRAKLENQVILVTGAAGSIGSELCRQIARFEPKLIVGLDVAETALFYLDRELRQSFPTIPFQPAIGSILNLARLSEVFDAYEVATVYHAAAYKHVPMMECHLFEAVENNVIGTHNVATTARRFGIENFVMISSDKAVRPTSVMGLTKRVAELVVSSLQNGDTRCVSVRFGNVLGSNGSVVAIFKQQIAAGGPVTVTHREMRRYFMTIPEAAQLVLQASTMGRGDEIFVLDMGQPMRIVDLARNMILLSGRRPEDIQIEFTGTRPGEKVYEELSTLEEETRPTYHDKIRIFSGDGVRIPDTESWMKELHRMCEARDMRLILALKELVADYNPSSNVLQCLVDQPKPLVAGHGVHLTAQVQGRMSPQFLARTE